MTKKIFAMFLAVLMVVSMLPTSVFAAEGDCPGKGFQHSLDNCKDYTTLNTTAPTCGDEGFTTYRCNVCGKEFMDNIVAPTGEHSYVEVPAEPASCMRPGKTAGFKCEVCGDEYGREETAPLYEDRVCEYTDWTEDPIDCTVGGFQTRYCKHCKVADPNPIKVPEYEEHEWSDWALTVAPTETTVGEAARKCTHEYCPVTETMEVYFPHDCVFDFYAEIPYDCKTGTDGMKAYYECRVCGVKAQYGPVYDKEGVFVKDDYIAMTEAEIAALVIPVKHTYDVEPTCKAPTQKCTVCEKNITETVAHTMVPDEDRSLAPTCTKPGYQVGDCAVCDYVVFEVIKPLEHITYTKTVPATCGTYGYTFTVCLRPGCDAQRMNNEENYYIDNNNHYFDCTLESVPVTAPVVDVPLTMVFTNGNTNKTGYFTGGAYVANYYLPLSEKAEDAVAIYLEAAADVENGYYIYFIDTATNAKTYIEMVKKDGKYTNAVYTTETPATAFKWNEKIQNLTTTFEDGEYVLGSRNDRNYFNIGCYLVEDEPFEAELFVGVVGTVHAFDVDVNYEAGFDPETHMVLEIKTESTCTTKGSIYRYCSNHKCEKNWYEIVELDLKAHDFSIEAEKKDLANAGIVAPEKLKVEATCLKDGYVWSLCADCGKLERRVLEKTGHKLQTVKGDDGQTLKDENGKDVIFEGKYEGSHTTDAYKYNVCENGNCDFDGGIIKFEIKPWQYLNYTWDTIEEAQAAHENSLVYVGTYRPGSCTTLGLEKWICKHKDADGRYDCDCKAIYVKQHTPALNTDGKLTFVGNSVVDNNNDGKIDGFVTGEHVSYSAVCIDPTCAYNSCQDEACIEARKGTDEECPNLDAHKKQGTCPLTQDPTCTEAGWTRTFKCDRCKAIVGNARVGYHNWKAATGHDMVANEEYEANPCHTPNYENVIKYCKTEGCDHVETDGTTAMGKITLSWGDYGNTWICDDYKTIEVYKCHCGEVHARNFVTLKHEWIVDVNGVKIDATCYSEGHQDLICKYCGISPEGYDPENGWKLEVLNKVPHKNAAGEAIVDSCDDTTVDRHCVECHKKADTQVGNHDSLGEAHDCSKTDENKDGVLDCICMIPKTCEIKLVAAYPSSCTVVPYQLYICDKCGKEEGKAFGEYAVAFDSNGIPTKFAPITLQGHQPEEAKVIGTDPETGAKIYEKYAAYDYFWFTPISYEVRSYTVIEGEGEAAKTVTYYYAVEVVGDAYLAKVDTYVEPEYTANGSFDGLCRVCNKTVHQEIAKKSGLGMELVVENANGADEFAVGSLVEVVVNANGANIDVQGFVYDVDYSGLVFVGYEIINNDFILTVTEPMDVVKNGENGENGELVITGRAANNASGKLQNITITEETPLVKLLFRAIETGHVSDEFGVDCFEIKLGYKRNNAYEMNSNTKIVLNKEEIKVPVREMFDFNGDGIFHITDLLQAESLLTFEHADGKTYDVTLDVNKDGEITPEDLTVAYNCYVGNLTIEECFLMGIDEAEAEFLRELKDLMTGHYCYNCKYELVGNETFCPNCGLKQP